MVEVICPSDNWNERVYILKVILWDFLGIEYRLNSGKTNSEYRLVLENGNTVVFQDHFFSRFKKNLEYLSESNFPNDILFAANRFVTEKNIPVLYGSVKLDIEDAGSGKTIITSGTDIFAASFFMLTRWEEKVSESRDQFGRFSARESVAYKYGFLDRPIVNEYADFLWNLLNHAGIEQPRKARKFSAYVTHDVDYVLKWYSFYGFLRTLAGDLIKRRSFRAFVNDLGDYSLTILKRKRDPYDTFDKLMSLSEESGFRSYFFFMSVEPKFRLKHFSLWHPFVKKLVREIDSRGHKIGFHPDLNTFTNPEKWKKELEWLQAVSPQKIEIGRQHFLQIQVPDTWQIWDDMEMKWDSSLSYDEIPGFRTGTCYSYPVFNFLTRKELHLRERPLTIMDKSLVLHSKGKNIQMLEKAALGLIDKVRKYQGDFVLLWHNNCFNDPEWKPYQELYRILITYLRNLKGVD